MKINWKLLATWIAGITGMACCCNSCISLEYGCQYTEYDADIVATDEAGDIVSGISRIETAASAEEYNQTGTDGMENK